MGDPREGSLSGDAQLSGMNKHKQKRKLAQAQKRAEYQKKKNRRAMKKIKKDPTPTGRTSYSTMKF
jgi:hypothetical protein